VEKNMGIRLLKKIRKTLKSKFWLKRLKSAYEFHDFMLDNASSSFVGSVHLQKCSLIAFDVLVRALGTSDVQNNQLYQKMPVIEIDYIQRIFRINLNREKMI
jgi:hypothetical protein